MGSAKKAQEGTGYKKALSGLTIVIRLLVFVLVCMLIFYGAKKIYALGYDTFADKAVSNDEGQDIIVKISNGMTDREVGEKLIEMGLTDESIISFMIQNKVYDLDIKPGTYTLNTSMTVEEMLEKMSEDKAEDEEN